MTLDDALFDSTDLSTHARRAAVRAMIGLVLPVTFDVIIPLARLL